MHKKSIRGLINGRYKEVSRADHKWEFTTYSPMGRSNYSGPLPRSSSEFLQEENKMSLSDTKIDREHSQISVYITQKTSSCTFRLASKFRCIACHNLAQWNICQHDTNNGQVTLQDEERIVMTSLGFVLFGYNLNKTCVLEGGDQRNLHTILQSPTTAYALALSLGSSKEMKPALHSSLSLCFHRVIDYKAMQGYMVSNASVTQSLDFQKNSKFSHWLVWLGYSWIASYLS